MKLQHLEINPVNGKIEIDIFNQNTPMAVIISEGRAKMTVLPEHGEAKIIMHQGKVKRVRYDIGEEF